MAPQWREAPMEQSQATPGVERHQETSAGGNSRWEKVIGYEVEPVPDEERERMKRLMEQESLKEITPYEALMSRLWRGEFDNNNNNNNNF